MFLINPSGRKVKISIEKKKYFLNLGFKEVKKTRVKKEEVKNG